MRFRRTSMPKLTPALDQPVLEENASTSGADAPPPPPTILFPRHTGPITALIVAVIVAYVSSFGAGWAGESLQTVRDNPQLSRATGAPLSGIVAPAETALSRDWARVVPRFTYWSNHNVDSVDLPLGFHLTNFILHLVACLLVYTLMLRVMRNAWPAFFGALLFGVHPLGTAAVTNIAGRPELFGAVWVLAGVVAYLRSCDKTGASRSGWILLVALFQALALLSHETGWALLPLLAVTFFVLRPRPTATQETEDEAPRGGVLMFIASIFPALLVAAAAAVAFGWRLLQRVPLTQETFTANPLLAADFLQARLTAIKVIGKYLWRAIWPASLAPDYSFDEIPLVTWRIAPWENWKAIIAAIAIIVLLVVAVRFARRGARHVLFFTLFFFIAVLPTANLLWLGRTIMREEYLYLPLVGVAGWLVAMVYIAARFWVPRMWALVYRHQHYPALVARFVLVLLACGLLVRTIVRNSDWQDDYSLWAAATEATPFNYRAHQQFAVRILRNGDAREYLRAAHHAGRAVELTAPEAWPLPQRPLDVLALAGTACRLQGDYATQHLEELDAVDRARAQDWYRRSIAVLEQTRAMDPGSAPPAEVSWNLGLAYTALARPADALPAFEALARVAPANTEAYLRLGAARLALQQLPEAAVAFMQAALIDKRVEGAAPALAQIFQVIDTEKCAYAYNQNNVRMNLECPLVRQLLGVAFLGLIENHLAAGDEAAARKFWRIAVEENRFAAEPFDDLLPDPATTPGATESPEPQP